MYSITFNNIFIVLCDIGPPLSVIFIVLCVVGPSLNHMYSHSSVRDRSTASSAIFFIVLRGIATLLSDIFRGCYCIFSSLGIFKGNFAC
jgi:hypothetical protein